MIQRPFLGLSINSLFANKPVIIFNTLPKSGSVFITQTLSKGLKFPTKEIGLHYFPVDLIIIDAFEKLAKEGGIAQEHLDASVYNLQKLKAFNCNKIIIHLRDPRQALLSWVHHVNKYKKLHPTLLLRTYPTYPENYFNLPLHDQINWNIEHYFPSFVKWIEQWVEAQKKEKDLTIKFTFYEDFVKDNILFIKEILKFYDISFNKYYHSNINKNQSTHFRKGETEEWRKIFTEEQKEKVTNLMPNEFFEIFPWKP